ncbi:hypothetical protein [Aneurinibacillus tyrosinisolvens]|uniref:hypothetical protein n=1 Tax=Aneurinibacillus tyrosinisolvens TaxID=1443435 RepID=UPI00063F5066|nr:hypothetical protein [Aneurinibacillus tyrosinisolvens]
MDNYINKEQPTDSKAQQSEKAAEPVTNASEQVQKATGAGGISLTPVVNKENETANTPDVKTTTDTIENKAEEVKQTGEAVKAEADNAASKVTQPQDGMLNGDGKIDEEETATIADKISGYYQSIVTGYQKLFSVFSK